MSETQKKILNIGVFVGLGMILFGGIGLLSNFGIEIHYRAWDFWPVVLILAGIGILLNTQDWSNALDGLFLLFIGVALLISNLSLIEGFRIRLWKLWPLLILYAGVKILIQALRTDKAVITGKPDFGISAVFGGGDYRFETKNLKSGKILAIFGGGLIDLREAEMEGDTMVVNCFALFGGIDLIVPGHWQVLVRATPILGAVDNKAVSKNISGCPANKTLYVEGTVMFGAIDIKN